MFRVSTVMQSEIYKATWNHIVNCSQVEKSWPQVSYPAQELDRAASHISIQFTSVHSSTCIPRPSFICKILGVCYMSFWNVSLWCFQNQNDSFFKLQENRQDKLNEKKNAGCFKKEQMNVRVEMDSTRESNIFQNSQCQKTLWGRTPVFRTFSLLASQPFSQLPLCPVINIHIVALWRPFCNHDD